MTIPHTEIASLHSKGDKSPYIDDVEAWLRTVLAAIPADEQWTTREFLGHLGLGEGDQAGKKRLTQALWWLRKLGRVDDCYTTDNTRRWYGNSLILWRKPVTVDEGIF